MSDMTAAAQLLRGLSEAADAPASDADERATVRTESDSSADERQDEEGPHLIHHRANGIGDFFPVTGLSL